VLLYRNGAEFLKRVLGYNVAYYLDPMWGNVLVTYYVVLAYNVVFDSGFKFPPMLLYRNGAEFLKRVLGYNVAYYSDPTWGNHGLIFRNSGFTDVRKHQYWDEAAKGLNFR
jgi:hypothetical protein